MRRWQQILAWMGLLLAGMPARSGDLASRLVGPIKGSGGAPRATWRELAGQKALDLQCPFDETGARRLFWDLPVSLDLRPVAGLRLTFHCADPGPIGQFSIYLRSNGVWHEASFAPQTPGNWEQIDIAKARTRPEGSANGWSRVDTIRIAAWRGEDRHTSMQLADIQTIAANPTVAILRGLGDTTYAGRIASALSLHGIQANIIDQADAQAPHLRAYRVLFVPHLPRPDAAVEEALLSYVANGGYPIVFYTVPERVLAALGLEATSYLGASQFAEGLGGVAFQGTPIPGAPERFIQHSRNIMGCRPRADQVAAWWIDATGKVTSHPAILVSPRGAWMTHVYQARDHWDGPRALLALAARFAPELWRTAALARLREAPRTIGADDMSAVVEAFQIAPPQTRTLVQKAVLNHNQAICHLAARRNLDALAEAEDCRRHLTAAVLSQTTPPAGEFRGAWCHRAEGIQGWTWEQTAGQLHTLGFTDIFPNVATASSAGYPSALLPPSTACRTKGDQLAACLKACHPRGIRVHAWLLCLSLGTEGAATRARSLESEGRLQTGSAGAVAPYLCPNHPANIALLRNTVQELAAKYPVDGIHLDFVRFAGEDYCYCPRCRQAFERRIGQRVRNWPRDARGVHRDQWLSFRRASISSLAKELRDTAKATRPSVLVSVAVFENWLTARDTVAQDWQAWCRRGWFDIVCPMNYTSSPTAFRDTVLRQQGQLGSAPVRLLPGIGMSSCRLEPMPLLRQIAATRDLRTGGFVLFEFNETEATQTLPQLAGALARPEALP